MDLENLDKNLPSEYEINTGRIFYLLDDDRQLWKKIDRDFLIDVFRPAMEWKLRGKKIVSIKYDGTNGQYLKDYLESGYPNEMAIRLSNKDLLPFPDYFLEPDKEYPEYWNLVEYVEQCIIKKDDWNYDLFFAMHFFVMDIVNHDKLQADEFLEYHLKNSFNNDVKGFGLFLDRVCLKYNQFLKELHEPLAKRFIESMKSTQKEAGEQHIKTEKSNKLKWLGTPSQFSFVFLELAKKGFIEIPATNGEASYSRLAKICWDLFEFQNKTTLENLTKEMNPNKNTLSDGVRAKFLFPSVDEISKKPKK